MTTETTTSNNIALPHAHSKSPADSVSTWEPLTAEFNADTLLDVVAACVQYHADKAAAKRTWKERINAIHGVGGAS